MNHFAFLQREWPGVFEAAGKAEAAVHADPRTMYFYAKRALELAGCLGVQARPGAVGQGSGDRDFLALRREELAARMNAFIQDKAGS